LTVDRRKKEEGSSATDASNGCNGFKSQGRGKKTIKATRSGKKRFEGRGLREERRRDTQSAFSDRYFMLSQVDLLLAAK